MNRQTADSYSSTPLRKSLRFFFLLHNEWSHIFKVLGQEASLSERVLRGTTEAARKRMTAWRNADAGCFWTVILDVPYLGGHLDVTHRAPAGTLRKRVKDATSQVLAVGALTKGFERMLGMVCSKYLPAGLYGCEGSAIYLCMCAQAIPIGGGTCSLV